MARSSVAVVIAAVAALAVGRLVIGHYPDEGPYLTVLPGHGVHLGDAVLLVLWLLLVLGLRRWVRRRPRSAPRARAVRGTAGRR